MTATDLTVLGNRLQSFVPVCPAAFVTAYIRQAATWFFQESEVWHYTCANIDRVAAEDTYKLDVGTLVSPGVEVLRIEYVENQSASVDPSTYDLDYYGTTPEGGEETFSYYLVFREDYIPATSYASALNVAVTLSPAVLGGYVSPRLWRQWSEAIMWGALSAMCSSRTRPWYDPVLAATAQDRYGVQLARARRERTQQFAYDGELRVTNPEGWL